MGRCDRWHEAEALARAMFQYRRDDPEAEPLEHVAAGIVLGRVCESVGRLDESETVLRAAERVARDTLGPDHAATLSATATLARTLERRGAFAEAEALRRAILETTRHLGDDDPAKIAAALSLAQLLLAAGRPVEAEPVARRVVAQRLRAFDGGTGDLDALNDLVESLDTLAVALRDSNRLEEAVTTLNDALARWTAAYSTEPAHPRYRLHLGECLRRLGRPEEARPLLVTSLDELRTRSDRRSEAEAELAVETVERDQREKGSSG
jgi:tetratricopeptide (TPR) repeat protein